MSTFLADSLSWNSKLTEFIERKNKNVKPKISERVQILLTVPKGMEQEFKDLAKLRRTEADANFKIQENPDRLALSMEFERSNPPPKRSDYE